MNARTFDPFFFDRLDEGFAANEDDEEETLVQQCPICGEYDLVLETDGRLVDLDGELHQCSEE